MSAQNMSDELRMQAFERAVHDIRDAVVAIARLEERHQETREAIGRAFAQLAAVEKEQSDLRLEVVTFKTEIKGEMAPLKEVRTWVISGVLAVVGIVGVAVISGVMVT